jgi:arsenate reductase (thioredoxin)
MIYPHLHQYMQELENEFSFINDERKQLLKHLTEYIDKKVQEQNHIDLVFICTHNSRRSHISQLWAQAAAYYYDIHDVNSCSGGTEVTAFNPRAVEGMRRAGFKIEKEKDGINPIYIVTFAEDGVSLKVFSKVYDDTFNPQADFAAVMTCSHADENCPVIKGVEKRISLPFNDPKESDDTPREAQVYDARIREIGREMLYAFSNVRQ